MMLRGKAPEHLGQSENITGNGLGDGLSDSFGAGAGNSYAVGVDLPSGAGLDSSQCESALFADLDLVTPSAAVDAAFARLELTQ